MKILLKNGTVLDYASNTNEKLDILIENNKIQEIAKDINCGLVKAGKLLAELDTAKGIGLVERVKQGQGKPTIIYVKQFTMLVPIPTREECAHSRPVKNEFQEVQKMNVQTFKNERSRPTENAGADLSKMNANYNNKKCKTHVKSQYQTKILRFLF